MARGGVEEGPLVGRVARKGLGDELHGRTFYAVIETPTGDAYHVTVAARVADELRVGDLVSLGTRRKPAVQAVDRHIAEVAAAHRGVYELAGDADRRDLGRSAGRRLRELARVGLVASAAPGQWTVPPDLVEQLEERHRRAAGRYRVALEPMRLGLDAQVGHRGPVWLDTLEGARLAAKGLGAEVLAALERRRHMLRELGISPDDPQRGAKIADLEQGAVGREIARQSGREFLESAPTGFRGRPRRGPEQTGRLVEVVRDAAGRAVLAEDRADRGELARQTAGEAFARNTRMTFLETVPEGFVGRVQAGPAGSSHLAVSDGARFVLIPATSEALAFAGRTVEVARDPQGRFVGLRPRSLDRER